MAGREKGAQRLLVFLPPHRTLGRGQLASSTVVSYVAVGAGGMTSGETPIALLPKAAAVDLVFDTADVFCAAIEAPRLSDPKLRLALPNLLEDRLLSEADNCHYAFTPITRAGGATLSPNPRLPVAAIDRGILTRALDVLAEAGYRARAAYDEIYTIPAPAAGVLSVRVDRGRGVARAGTHDGFAFDFEGADGPPALILAVRQLGIRRIHAFGRDAARLAQLADRFGLTVDVVNRDADLAATDGAINLLQGPFAAGGMLGSLSVPRVSVRALKAPLAWLGVAALVFIGGMNAYWLKLESEMKALKSGMETAFRSTFPEATAVVDPVLQAKRSMGALRARAGIASPDDFSVLNAQAAQLFTLAPVGAVAGLEYRDGALRIRLKAGTADNPMLQNNLRAQATQQGLSLRFEGDAARLLPAGQ
jgi:general secretion pathway protein L